MTFLKAMGYDFKELNPSRHHCNHAFAGFAGAFPCLLSLATGIAYRLFRSGFRVVMTKPAQPMVSRKTATFARSSLSG